MRAKQVTFSASNGAVKRGFQAASEAETYATTLATTTQSSRHPLTRTYARKKGILEAPVSDRYLK